jgi:hypothetical protein
MTIGNIVLMPWPTSGFFDMIVITPSGVIRMKALGVKSPPACRAPASSALAPSRYEPSSRPPPASAVTRRKERRSTFNAVLIVVSYSARPFARDATSLVGVAGGGGAVPAA